MNEQEAGETAAATPQTRPESPVEHQDHRPEAGEAEPFGSPVDEEETKAGPEVLTNALPGRVEAWRRRSAMGAVLTGFALGLQEALESKRDEPAVIVQTSGTPPSDLPVEADVQQLLPSQSVVKVRPWLLEADETAAPDTAGSGNGGNGDEGDNGADGADRS